MFARRDLVGALRAARKRWRTSARPDLVAFDVDDLIRFVFCVVCVYDRALGAMHDGHGVARFDVRQLGRFAVAVHLRVAGDRERDGLVCRALGSLRDRELLPG